MEVIKHLSAITIYGLTIIFIGLMFRYWVNRRRFNRRNGAGKQGFHNYEERVSFPIIEKLIKLIGLLLLLAGLFLITIDWFNHYCSSKNSVKQQTINQPY